MENYMRDLNYDNETYITYEVFSSNILTIKALLEK